MSFVQSHADQSARAKAVIVVGGVHALLGAGLVLGLTFTVWETPDKNLPSRLYPTAPLPVEPPTPPETSRQNNTAVPIPVPVPPNPFHPPEAPEGPPVADNPPAAPTGYIPGPTPAPTYAPIPPAPTFSPVAARPSNSPAGWITNADYPSAPLRRGEEGTAAYRLVIGSDGRVNECQITASTGSRTLDTTTCRFLERRARFEPATDQSGRTVVGTYNGQVTWEIPD